MEESANTHISENRIGSAAKTLVDRIVENIAEQIESGHLHAGAKLLSIRRQAAQRRVSVSTIVEAYDRLVARGYLVSKHGRGFFVRETPSSSPITVLAEQRVGDPSLLKQQHLGKRHEVLHPGVGRLPLSWLDGDVLRKAMRSMARSPRTQFLDYGSRLGYEPLRDQLRSSLFSKGIVGERDLLLTLGATNAVDLVCRFVLQPGDTVFVDDPGYPRFLSILAERSVRIVGIPFTRSGPDVATLVAKAESCRPSLYLTTASPHNPTGVCMTPANIYNVLSVAEKFNFRIIEDDVLCDLILCPQPQIRFYGLHRQSDLHRKLFQDDIGRSALWIYFWSCRPDRSARRF